MWRGRNDTWEKILKFHDKEREQLTQTQALTTNLSTVMETMSEPIKMIAQKGNESEKREKRNVPVSAATFANQIPDFSRNIESGLKWEQYISKFDNIAVCAGWTDKEKAAILTAKLSGRALEYHKRLIKTNTTMSYAALVKKLEDKFKEQISEEIYKMKFSQSLQLPGEDPREFGEKLEKLHDLAYPMNNTEESEDVRSIKDAMRDDKIKTAFIMGAETSLRTYLR